MNNLELAVNYALAVNTSSTRNIASYLGKINVSGNSKRGQLYTEFGYPSELSFSHYYNMYERNAIAGAAIDLINSGCWEDYPEVFEGAKKEDAKGDSKWDKTVAKLLKKWFPVLKEADKRGAVGNYSAILIQINDGEQWNKPVNTLVTKQLKEKAIVRLIPVWEEQIKTSEWQEDTSSPDYGYPAMYSYTNLPVSGSSSAPAIQTDVHPDRVIILCENSILGLLSEGKSKLRKGFNDALDLEKISGGAAEGFLKNASRQLNFNFSKDTDLDVVAKMYGVAIDKLANAIDEQVRRLNESTDSAVIMQDGSASVLSVAPADPQSSFNVSLCKFAASVQIPVKILIGQITGDRASAEDNKTWAKTRISRRNNFLTPLIESFIGRLWALGILDIPKNEEITVSWSDLLAPSQAEKLDNANKLAEIAQKSIIAFGVSVIKQNEIRAAAELTTLEEFEDDAVDDPTNKTTKSDPLDDKKQDKESTDI